MENNIASSSTETLLQEIRLESWMSDLPYNVRSLPLNNIYIPGSHDSFSYTLKGGQIGPDSPLYITCLASIPCVLKDIFLRWSITQRSSVSQQLQHGIRYFDIRVAIRDDKFYFVHLLLGSELYPVMIEIRKFLDDRPGEVVLIDFQHFYGFDYDDHLCLLKLITKIFSGIICPWFQSLENLSLEFLAQHKYRVILFYRKAEFQKLSEFWPGSALPNPWPDTTDIPYLMSFVKQELEVRDKDKFFVTQCVLTPTLGYILRNVTTSLEKKLAVPCNEAISGWLSSLSRNMKLPNVVMTDFVNQHDWEIPRIVIRCNWNLMQGTEVTN